jgi:hypothetical protein
MNGFITKKRVATGMAGALVLASGCGWYRNIVDPCYPDRYEFAARQEVKAAVAPQVNNGHVLDQTIWAHYWEPGTANLTPQGIDRLEYLVRRRPTPDPVIYLQTAQPSADDIRIDPTAPAKFAQDRATLDEKRKDALRAWLAALTSGRGLSFEVMVHDPPNVGVHASPMGIALQKSYASFQGSLPTTAGAGAAGATGGAGAPATAGGGGK